MHQFSQRGVVERRVRCRPQKSFSRVFVKWESVVYGEAPPRGLKVVGARVLVKWQSVVCGEAPPEERTHASVQSGGGPTGAEHVRFISMDCFTVICLRNPGLVQNMAVSFSMDCFPRN